MHIYPNMLHPLVYGIIIVYMLHLWESLVGSYNCNIGYRQPPTVLGKVLLIGVMPIILENTL